MFDVLATIWFSIDLQKPLGLGLIGEKVSVVASLLLRV